MKKILRYVLIACVLVTALAACHRKYKLIPKGDMIDIYEEIYVIDQWVFKEKTRLKRQIDTSRIYEPVFNKYGYTAEDFRYSDIKYLRNPDKYAKMMKEVSKRLEARAEVVGAQIAEIERIEQLRKKHKDFSKIYLKPMFPDSVINVAPSFRYDDSLGFFIFYSDTARYNMALRLRDSLQCSRDSLRCYGDSLQCCGDSLKCCKDSLRCSGDSLLCRMDSLQCGIDSLKCCADSLKID